MAKPSRPRPVARLAALLLGLAWLGSASPAVATPSPAGSPGSPGDLAGEACRAAIAVAEREAGIPAGLLQAIGRVESGRRDPGTGRFAPWPWTINAEGRGQFFSTREEAVAAVRQLQARGMRSIDIGCMQINLRHHPQAFASLEEGFDPLANARYAARFLTELQASRGDWLRAAANYHSNTPEFADAYRGRVAAAWPEEQRRLGQQPPQPWQASMAGGSAGLSARGAAALGTARAMPAGQGRGLDAYRAMPIPLAGRVQAFAPLRRF